MQASYVGLTPEFKIRKVKAKIAKSQVDVNKLRELSSQLTDKFQRLETTQESISELLLNENQENEYSKDFNEIEIYREQYLSLKLKTSKIILSPNRSNHVVTESIELKTFNGDIKSFLGFWSQFSRIHEAEEMPSEDKFQYLIQAIIPGTRAASLIEIFPLTAQNYPKEIELLKERFGREDLLVQVYERELLKMVMKIAVSERKCADLTTLYDQLESHLRALDTFPDSNFSLQQTCTANLQAYSKFDTTRVQV
ncbi:hypothetical protein AVEN_28615-1 [Araneus ventricosus]|uniref:Uncharacterized protein n=1 Tax=Araneus ventricosus TaxID=182803 RepID=A0A4Y2DGB4_ARAVE|nr:hypothetical protein AVEN_28615-1 [Araneus ventricosus]